MRNPGRFNATLGTVLSVALLLAQASAALAHNKHTLPLFVSASHQTLQGFARIINLSDRDGEVTIHAIDDTGQRFGPVTLSLEARVTRHFSSEDLRDGNTGKGLSGGVGTGQGNWHLELETDLDIEPLAYSRPRGNGFVTSSHDVTGGASMRWHVVFFNPGSNVDQQSWLRVVNVSGIDTEVTVEGLDDDGAAGAGTVSFDLPADGARMLSARELEEGSADSTFDGRLGDGAGKWQLFVSANRPIQVMSLLLGQSGNLTNLSTVTRDAIVRGGPQADELRGGNGDDVIDPGDNAEGFDLVHGSLGDDRIVYTGSGPDGWQMIEYSSLDAGITVTIDGAANRAAVDKGTAGTDTIVDIVNPLRAGGRPPSYTGDFRRLWAAEYYGLWTDLVYGHGFPPYNGGFTLDGTPFDDVFDLSLREGQWMSVEGGAGADTFDLEGEVMVDYGSAPAGVDVDLGTGYAGNDGYGDADSFEGRVWGVAGSMFSDEIRGDDDDEVFVGRAGNDAIDGGGGLDLLHFGDRTSVGGPLDVENLVVDLGEGTATGTWNGAAFSYTISNVEAVIGGGGDDTLLGGPGFDALDGGSGNDILNPGTNDNDWDIVIGSDGDDTIVYSDSDDRSYNEVHYSRLDAGPIRAVIDGRANRATVDKGSAGTDTIVDIANSLYWGVGLHGTRFDDVFDLRLDDGDWMQVRGNAGNDTIIAGGGYVRIDYRGAPSGIRVDLGAGTAFDDGFGDSDSIQGRVREVRGSDFNDVIRGSDEDESFIGRGGDDEIDGGGGIDRLRFDRTGVGNLIVDMDAGTATGTWDGTAFSYTFSGIEHVRGGAEMDIIADSEGDDVLEGGRSTDLFILSGNGNDTIVDFERSRNDESFIDDDEITGDILVLADIDNDGGVTRSDIIAMSREVPDGTLIDLSSQSHDDGGTILLRGITREDLQWINLWLPLDQGDN